MSERTVTGWRLRMMTAGAFLLCLVSVAQAATNAIPFTAIAAGQNKRFGPYANNAGIEKEFEFLNTVANIFNDGTNVRIRFLWNPTAAAAAPTFASQWINFNNLPGGLAQANILDTGTYVLAGDCPQTVWLEIQPLNFSIDAGGDYRHDCVGEGAGSGTSIQPVPVCEFDTTGDGVPELVAPDDDQNGFCDFPDGQTELSGTLVITGQVELHGSPSIKVDGLVIEPDGVLRGDSSTLHDLTITARTGGILAEGTLQISANDDISLVAKGGPIYLFGPTNVAAADRLVIDVRDRWLMVAPSEVDPAGPLTLLGRNRLSLRAKQFEGNIFIDGATVGGGRVTLEAAPHTSEPAPKLITITGGSLITTDPARTGSEVAGDIRITATGDIDIDAESRLDAGRNIKIGDRQEENEVCVAGGSVLQAQSPEGEPRRIDFRPVSGVQADDGTAVFDGLLYPAARRGTCTSPEGDCVVTGSIIVASAWSPIRVAAAHLLVTEADAAPTAKDVFLDEHKRIRNAENNALANLTWDDDAQKAAQDWANKLAEECKCKHNGKETGHGQNTAQIANMEGTEDPNTGEISYTLPVKRADLSVVAGRAMRAWEREKDKKTNNNVEFDKTAKGATNWCSAQPPNGTFCGHYSQIVWTDKPRDDCGKGTQKVGCGITRCKTDPDKSMVVCDYTNPGNFTPCTAY